MNTVCVSDGTVAIKIEGMDKLWSFKGALNIPRKAIVKAYLRPENMKPPRLRAPGTYLPHIIAAGTYRGLGKKEFWDTHFQGDCVVFDLAGFDYTRVVVDVPDARSLLEALA